MKKTFILLFVLVISIAVFGSACRREAPFEKPAGEVSEEVLSDEKGEKSRQVIEEEPTEETADEEAEATEEAPQNAIFNIKFEAVWSERSHPDNYVSSAHFSPFVAYSYNGIDEGRIFIKDSIATPGMEEMAETGATGLLEGEINQIIEAGNALTYIKATRIDSPGQIEESLEFTQEFSRFIFVTMIAPSPDWFIAGGMDLFIDGQWIDKAILDLISYDAGTDSGDSLIAENTDTDPKQTISRFDDSLQKLGIITISRR